MAIEISVEAELRDGGGKGAARKLRRGGKIPAVLYGAKRQTVSLTLNPRDVAAVLHSEAGHNTIFEVKVKGGENTAVMIVDYQREPVHGAFLHVDLKRIAMDQSIRVKVPIETQGEAIGVKTDGGILELVTREIEIECLPTDIPDQITIDVSPLAMNQNFRVSDLKLGANLRVLTDADRVIAHVIAVKEVEVAPAPVEGAEAAPAEPEVIKKGKAETGEEGEEAAEAKPAKGEAKPAKAEKEKEKEKK
jgi:large subunit ribosomal protein L25